MSRVLCVRVSFKGKELISRTFQGQSITIGRDADCDIRLDNVGVSRQHACIDLQGPGYLLRDLGSSNGTVVGDRPISAWPIQDGDHARIAKFDLEFRLAPDSTTSGGASIGQVPGLSERDTMVAAYSGAEPRPAAKSMATPGDARSYWRYVLVLLFVVGSCALAASVILMKGN